MPVAVAIGKTKNLLSKRPKSIELSIKGIQNWMPLVILLFLYSLEVLSDALPLGEFHLQELIVEEEC